MTRTKLKLTVMLAAMLAVLHSPTAVAGDVEYRIMPYLWTAGIDAELGPPGRTTSANVSFSDYVGFIDIGGAFAFEAKGDRWTFIADVLWVKLSEDIDLPASTADFENEQLVLELGVGYRPRGWKETWIVAGVRSLDMDTTIRFRDRVEVGTGQAWADPFVGLGWRPRRGDWEFVLEGDVGGGVDADFTWAFIVGGGYHFNDRIGVGAAYRFLDSDFEDSEFVFDGTLEGLAIGLVIKF